MKIMNWILGKFKIPEKITVENKTADAIDGSPKIAFVFATEFNLPFEIVALQGDTFDQMVRCFVKWPFFHWIMDIHL